MLQGLFNTLIFLGSFAFVLGLLVFIHEMGHYSVARLFNISVERFSVGFGKPIYRRKAKSGTEWVIGRIPLGGYVKFLGDAGAASNPDTERLKKIKLEMDRKLGKDAWKSCFHFKPLWQRTLVVLAGPIANFILAAVIFMGSALAYGQYTLAAKIASVTPGSVAERAGFLPGDEFVSINGKAASEYRKVSQTITLNTGTSLTIIVNRDNRPVELMVTPERKARKDAIGGEFEGGAIGVGFANNYVRKDFTVPQAAKHGVYSVYDSIASTGLYIGRIFQGKENGKALGGIVKIAAITGKVGVDAANTEGSVAERAGTMFKWLINIAAMLSVGLGFANLMPIPVLDGGHLMYYGYEAVMRRPLGERAQEIGFRVGFAALITLFLVLTWNDIGYVSGLFNNAG